MANIKLTPLLKRNPIEIPEAIYDKLSKKKDRGWTEVDSEEEFLAKLHYLRAGMAENKRPKEELLKTEEKLVIKFWEKHL